MPAPWQYRGRAISDEDLAFIQQLIREQPGASRRALSAKLCEAWQWKQSNGAPRDMVCRGLLLMLHRAGEIKLPPVRYTPPNPLAKRRPPVAMLIDTTPIQGRLTRIIHESEDKRSLLCYKHVDKTMFAQQKRLP
jgi:hypothetical protein